MALSELTTAGLAPVPGILDALREVAARDRFLSALAGHQAGEGWMPLEDLPTSGMVERQMVGLGESYGTRDRRVIASMLVLRYGWYLAAPLIGSYMLEGKVPRTTGNVEVQPCPDGTLLVAFLRDAGAVIEGDPAEALPEVVAVASREELRAGLGRELVEAHEPLVALLGRVTPFSTRTLWRMLADRWGEVCAWVGTVMGDPLGCVLEGQRLLELPGAPWRRPPSFVYLEHAGRGRAFLARATCCCSYRLPGGAKCSTCPLLPEEERMARMLAVLEGSE